jgi:hypothetical protein
LQDELPWIISTAGPAPAESETAMSANEVGTTLVVTRQPYGASR